MTSELEERFSKEDAPMILLRLGSVPTFTTGPKLRRTTLRRLTTIPGHKKHQVHRHFPVMAPQPGSKEGIRVHGLEDLMASRSKTAKAVGSDDEPAPSASMDKNERRKEFLTMSNLKRVFRVLDIGEDGFIGTDDLFEAQMKIGGTLSKEEVRDVVWEVDDTMVGRLDMNQYLTAYRRSSADESGFEPKRFWAIVEFLLMDRDCSGEISLDEAMTTIFERQGADDLATVTRSFFRAAGVGDSEEPPPGATVTFMGYYTKVGRAKPRVPNKQDLRRSWSNQKRVEAGKQLPPVITRAHSEASLLPTLLAASKAAHASENRPLAARIPGMSMSPTRGGASIGASARGASSHSPERSRKRGGGEGSSRRPATSPDILGGGALSSSGSGGFPMPGRITRGASRKGQLDSLATLQLTENTVGLAASAMSYAGRDGAQSTAVKEKAAKVLHIGFADSAPSGVSRPELS